MSTKQLTGDIEFFEIRIQWVVITENRRTVVTNKNDVELYVNLPNKQLVSIVIAKITVTKYSPHTL